MGGGSELGEAVATRFAGSYFKKWKVINLDYQENSKATKNLIIPKGEVALKPELIETLGKEVKDYAEELDAIINISDI